MEKVTELRAGHHKVSCWALRSCLHSEIMNKKAYKCNRSETWSRNVAVKSRWGKKWTSCHHVKISNSILIHNQASRSSEVQTAALRDLSGRWRLWLSAVIYWQWVTRPPSPVSLCETRALYLSLALTPWPVTPLLAGHSHATLTCHETRERFRKPARG